MFVLGEITSENVKDPHFWNVNLWEQNLKLRNLKWRINADSRKKENGKEMRWIIKTNLKQLVKILKVQ